MLVELSNIRNLTSGFDDPYEYNALEARIRRSEAFRDILLTAYPILGYCGCGTPEATLETVLRALDYCALSDGLRGEPERAVFLREHFGVEHITDSGLVQFLFYILLTLDLLEHNYTLNLALLTKEGEIFRELLADHLELGH